MERHNIIRRWSERNRPNPAYASLRDEGYRGILLGGEPMEPKIFASRPVPFFYASDPILQVEFQMRLIGRVEINVPGFFYNVCGLLLDKPIDYIEPNGRDPCPREELPLLEKCGSALTWNRALWKQRDVARDIVDYAIAYSGLPEMNPYPSLLELHEYKRVLMNDPDFIRQCKIMESEMKGGSKNNEL